MKFDYKKIIIVGCGGAGKSTLARIMGEKLNLPVVHLDKIYWLPNWNQRDCEEFDYLLLHELKKDTWIIDGNFSRTLSLRLEYADICIFLDYPTELCIDSVNERILKYQNSSRPDMTEGCEEKNDPEFIEWIKSYHNDVKPALLETLKNSKKPYIIFKSREETENWLNDLN